MLNLNLPDFEPKLKKEEGQLFIKNLIDNAWFKISPEEYVRQNWLYLLLRKCNMPQKCIKLEYPVKYNNQVKRADIVVMNQEAGPGMLVECKAPHVEINESVLLQGSMYQSVLDSKYVIISNGISHLMLGKTGKWEKLDWQDLPDYSGLIK